MRVVKEYWKRFVASAIGFGHKYRFDPFFRTEINIIALQGAFALFLLAVVAAIAGELYRDASNALSQGITAALEPYSSPTLVGNSVIATLDYTRSRTISYAALAIVLITALFTYVITRMALAPTRAALASQKRFIGNIAHELRTPLSIIKTNTEVRLMDNDVPNRAATTHRENLEELNRISDIINNLLSLSASIRVEHLEFKGVDLGNIVQETIRKMRALSEKKHLALEMRLSERRSVHGNATALEQIVMNLLKNAILYTQEGSVLVVVEPVFPDAIELSVQDSGRGIARKDLFRIFEPFFRTDASRKRNGSGSGLGLTIVSELVKLHNGKITVRSAEGRGTTVTVLLPAARNADEKQARGTPRRGDTSEVAVDFSSSH